VLYQSLLHATLLLLVVLSTACSSGPQPNPVNYPPTVFTAERLLPEQETGFQQVYDPWEGMNKRIYNFNYHFDKSVFVPVVRGYKAVVPKLARTGIHNFFRNFDDVGTMINSVLQLAPGKFFESTGRVVINSTVGVFGLIDVASMMEIPRPEEDFGQTLGYWGVAQGPYLMLPLLGPSNLRDGLGKLPDLYVRGAVQDEVLSDPVALADTLLFPVDTRENTAFRYYQTGSAFEYEMVRWLFSTKRKLDVIK
jgi:phospholipid-binding lipoprotein MlaA